MTVSAEACTAPVKPNRAQQILFGPTLESYLYGEQIGQTLLTKSALQPLMVCTDVVAALAVRDYVPTPVALVVTAGDDTPSAVSANLVWRVDTAQRDGSRVLAALRFDRGRVFAGHALDDGEREGVRIG